MPRAAVCQRQPPNDRVGIGPSARAPAIPEYRSSSIDNRVMPSAQLTGFCGGGSPTLLSPGPTAMRFRAILLPLLLPVSKYIAAAAASVCGCGRPNQRRLNLRYGWSIAKTHPVLLISQMC